MDNSRATFGIDLHLDVSGSRRKRALEEALRQAIAQGRLRSGTRLPSSRSLAADLGLARNTVVDVYAQLTAEGWLAARHGSGTKVADRPLASEVSAVMIADAPGSWSHDFRVGWPDLSSFPRSAWLDASRRAWSSAPDAELGYGDPRGTRALREEVTGYLGRARGVRTDASRIVICSGFTQAVGLLCRALHERGATALAVESYGLPETRQIANDAHLAVETMPIDENGALVSSAGAANAAMITPAHQFPLGMAMSPERRHDALGWARSRDALIIEDDYDGEFRYDREPVGALQGLDPDHVVYLGTTSKTLAPGLRLAWMILPGDLVEPVARAKRLADRFAPALDQLTLAEFIRSGAYDRHVRRRRLAYRHRRDRLVGALAAAQVEGISAGLQAVVGLPAGVTEAEAIASADESGIALEGLDIYRVGPAAHPPALVVGFATPPEHAYAAAISGLGKVLAGLSQPHVSVRVRTRAEG